MQHKMVWVVAIVCIVVVLSPILGVAEDQNPKEEQNAFSLNMYLTFAELLLNVTPAEGLSGNTAPVTFCIPVAINYQRVMANHLVLFVAPTFIYYRSSVYTILTLDQKLAVDWHPFDRGLNGWFFGAFLDFDYLYNGGITSAAFSYSVGPSVGYELTLQNNLQIEFAFGVGIGSPNNSYLNMSEWWFATPPYRLDFGLGYRF
jgi:hypothetical protein